MRDKKIARVCEECGMIVDDYYHPYAACMMFKSCKDPVVVKANLDAVRANGAQWEYDRSQPRIIELEAKLSQLQRGEYICKKCGIRKDANPVDKGDF